MSQNQRPSQIYDAVVVGGGPSGSTAATDLARQGRSVLLLDKAGRIKPCGGAIPPQVLKEFDVPEHLLVARIKSARIIAPSHRHVDMPVDDGFVGMVDRDVFDEWLRERARLAGAKRLTGTFSRLDREADGTLRVYCLEKDTKTEAAPIRARMVIGADGANSRVARQEVPEAADIPFVFAYHEIIASPNDENPSQTMEPSTKHPAFDAARCDVYYQGHVSPDFYGWVFPHGSSTSVGVGSAQKGFSLREAVRSLRSASGLQGMTTKRCEGAPIPLRPAKRFDNGKDVVLAGDAAGLVAPASGEGIYYAMLGGRLAADAVHEALETGNAKALASARRRFVRTHGRIFWILGMMQHFWYRNDKRRERFVKMCADKDVQRMTWEAYMNKRIVRERPLSQVKVFLKDMAHLLGVARV